MVRSEAGLFTVYDFFFTLGGDEEKDKMMRRFLVCALSLPLVSLMLPSVAQTPATRLPAALVAQTPTVETNNTQKTPDITVEKRLKGFDEEMAKTLKEWNVPGCGIGIVIGDKLVFAKGYGYRDYEKKLPFTSHTLFPIASNTKLFTAVAAGMVVEEGKLTWDKPVSETVPSIVFQNDNLYKNITLRDMLSHRTGITRHDMIWYKSDFTRKDLFQRLKYMEPQAPIRTQFLYNNLMYVAAGYLIELQTGKTWEKFVQERILTPLNMNDTLYDMAEMQKKPDFGVSYIEKRDSFDLYRFPDPEDVVGSAPCGAIISNIEDMSHWVAALLNDGKYQNKQVLPASVLKATMEPAIALPNTDLDTQGYGELLNETYGMGRYTAAYRGHLLAFHTGTTNGFRSQVTLLPQDKIGILVFLNVEHAEALRNVISFNLCERLLGMNETPWSARRLAEYLKSKKAIAEARVKAGTDRVANTKPSHSLADYVAEYENEAYGVLKIGLSKEKLQFDFHTLVFPLNHYHYDRFDTPDDEHYGKYTVNFSTNPQGDVDKATLSLDEAEVVFRRKPDTLSPERLKQLAGEYINPDKSVVKIIYTPEDGLIYTAPGIPNIKLFVYKGLKFRCLQFPDRLLEFVMEKDVVKAAKLINPDGELVLPRKMP